MKTPNLRQAQQTYLSPKERSLQRFVTVATFFPLFIVVLMFLFSLGNPEYVFNHFFWFSYMLFFTLLLFFTQRLTKKKYLKRFRREQLERMEAECLSAPTCEGFMVTKDALMYFMPGIMAIPIEELVWVYPLFETHRKGMFMSKTYYAIIAVTKNKKEYRLLRENLEYQPLERSMKFLEETLKQLRPNLIMGYTEALSDMRKNNFQSMIQMSETGTGFDKDTALATSVCEPRKKGVVHI